MWVIGFFFFFQAEDGIRDRDVTGVQTCALPISHEPAFGRADGWAVTLVERFGALGVAGLRALAERFPEPESFGWMRRIADLVERGVIAREHMSVLRELAAR